MEAQNQKVEYQNINVFVKGCGFFFPFPVPPDKIICAMKISAMLSRQKGRDFYDVMFLLNQTKPSFSFLSAKNGINNMKELKQNIKSVLKKVDLKKKQKDFEHLLFNKKNSDKILYAREFFDSL